MVHLVTHSYLIQLYPLGDYELVSMLLRKGADPYISLNTTSFGPGSRGFGNAFAAAAAHGHKNILRKLLAEPGAHRDTDMLSLAEILSEGLYFVLFSVSCYHFLKYCVIDITCNIIEENYK